MIFLTLGTYPMPFDRLLTAVDELNYKGLIDDVVFGQIGHTNYLPKTYKAVKVLEKEEFDEVFHIADSIISHAGIGTITMAIDLKKPLLVMPRLKKYKEVVNDHQLGAARKFEELGNILSVYETKDLKDKIDKLKYFVPSPRANQADLISARIKKYLCSL